MSNRTALALSERCFQAVGELEPRQACFDRLRVDFYQFCTGCTEADVSILNKGPPTLVASILMTNLHKLTDRVMTSTGIVDVLFDVLAYTQTANPSKLSYAGILPEAEIKCGDGLLNQAHRGINLAICDKLYRHNDASLVDVVVECVGRNVAANSQPTVDFSKIDPKNEALHPSVGFRNLGLIYIACLSFAKS